MCGNRRLLFDNKTKDKSKKAEQLQELLSLVNQVVKSNGGKPFTDELFVELKKEAQFRDGTAGVNSMEDYFKQVVSELKDQIPKSYEDRVNQTISGLKGQLHELYEEQQRRTAAMFQSRLETILSLEEKLVESQAAHMKAKAWAEEAQTKLNDETNKMREHLERTQRETEELRERKCGSRRETAREVLAFSGEMIKMVDGVASIIMQFAQNN